MADRNKQSSARPTRRPDLALSRKYGGLIAGIDEAGRGPWAGPVVAAAVIFHKTPPKGLNDSKKLKSETREKLYNQIIPVAHIGVGIVSVTDIDALNIYHATHSAMTAALHALPMMPVAILVDGNRCPKVDIPAEPLIGGDGFSISIAAASIIAKVTRDRIMRELSVTHPVYCWERNKGYGTKEHAAALDQYGHCEHHRQSFRPIRERMLLGISA